MMGWGGLSDVDWTINKRQFGLEFVNYDNDMEAVEVPKVMGI